MRVGYSPYALGCQTSLAPGRSRDERIFLLTAVALGLEEAIYQASIYRWKCQLPLRVLRAMMYEYGPAPFWIWGEYTVSDPLGECLPPIAGRVDAGAVG